MKYLTAESGRLSQPLWLSSFLHSPNHCCSRTFINYHSFRSSSINHQLPHLSSINHRFSYLSSIKSSSFSSFPHFLNHLSSHSFINHNLLVFHPSSITFSFLLSSTITIFSYVYANIFYVLQKQDLWERVFRGMMKPLPTPTRSLFSK